MKLIIQTFLSLFQLFFFCICHICIAILVVPQSFVVLIRQSPFSNRLIFLYDESCWYRLITVGRTPSQRLVMLVYRVNSQLQKIVIFFPNLYNHISFLYLQLLVFNYIMLVLTLFLSQAFTIVLNTVLELALCIQLLCLRND